MKYDNYSYYKGEKQNPYEGKNYGKSFWWKLEREAFEHGDRKRKKELSKTMEEHIREKTLKGDGQADISLEVALIRATEMYKMGVWAQSYVTEGRFTLDMAIKESRMNDNPKQFLISQCRYYKGEEENPFDLAARTDPVAQNKAMLWFYEQSWVNANLHSYETGEPDPALSDYYDEYLFTAGLSDFEHDDGVPISLKALLLNRYAKWSGGGLADAVDDFRKWYIEYYRKG